MVTLNLKLCFTVSRGGMVYEKPFKDIPWSLIFRNCPNYVTEILIFSDLMVTLNLKLCLH